VRAWLNLRFTVPERRRAFRAGLERLGYVVNEGFPDCPTAQDVLVTWNRIGDAHRIAGIFEKAGARVLVAENATWGNEFAGRRWYTITRHYHNLAGAEYFDVGDADRWRRLNVALRPFRRDRNIWRETVILPQRGIGPERVRMPSDWTHRARCDYPKARVRIHPGTRDGIELERDLMQAGQVVTWGSGAAVKALLWGIPVRSYLPGWIAEQDNTDEGRLAMFERLAWAQWDLSEIERGVPFERLLQGAK
jgi:hypothetical protein